MFIPKTEKKTYMTDNNITELLQELLVLQNRSVVGSEQKLNVLAQTAEIIKGEWIYKFSHETLTTPI